MATFLSLLPLVLQVLGLLLKWYGASEDTIEKFMSLVESTKNDGLISVKTKDTFLAQKEAILKRLAEKKSGDTNAKP